MDMVYGVVGVLVGVLLAAGVFWLLLRKRLNVSGDQTGSLSADKAAKSASMPARKGAAVLADAVPEKISRITVGRSVDQPAFEISLLSDESGFARAPVLPSKGGLGVVSKMSACLQAVPSMMVQQSHQGRMLMEVMINKPLANASSGNLFLPFARGENGKIAEMAKLANPEGLQALVNSAAVWQVASVVVAQKHLADISAKLDDIKKGIDDIKGLHQDRLDGDIEGTYLYLQGVAQSFSKGEVPKFARVELEACRRDLLKISSGLVRMFERRLGATIDHRETMGTGDLLAESMARYEELDRIRSSLTTCFKTQALCWHVVSLFPDEEVTAELWKAQTLENVAAFAQIADRITAVADADAQKIKSWVNFGSTLSERRVQIRGRGKQSLRAIWTSNSQIDGDIAQTALLLQHSDDTIKLGVEISDGLVQQIRVLEGATLPMYEDAPLQSRLREMSEEDEDSRKWHVTGNLRPLREQPAVLPTIPTPMI